MFSEGIEREQCHKMGNPRRTIKHMALSIIQNRLEFQYCNIFSQERKPHISIAFLKTPLHNVVLKKIIFECLLIPMFECVASAMEYYFDFMSCIALWEDCIVEDTANTLTGSHTVFCRPFIV